MSPKIDERYPYLAAEDMWKKISPYLEMAVLSRPNSNDFTIDRFINIYGFDITTLAILSDSPITNKIASNFEGTLIGAWRLLNKIWALRLELKSAPPQNPAPVTITNNHYKVISQAHITTSELYKSFDDNKYYALISSIAEIVPNFYAYLCESLEKST